MIQKRQDILDQWQSKAETFAKDFAGVTYEMGAAQSYIREFCDIFGVGWRLIRFEERIKKENGGGINRIDGFLPELLLIEMKSAGKNLKDAREQAFGYVQRLEACYGAKSFKDEPTRLAFLFELYAEYLRGANVGQSAA